MPSIAELLAAAPVRLAPMASYTNVAFRQIAVRCGSGFTTNEEIDAEAFLHDNPRTLSMTRRHRDERMLAMQLLGADAQQLAEAAVRLVDLGAEIIDINMGCPAPKVTKRGKGAALMRDLDATARLLATVRAAISVPLTIKIRGGWDETHLNAVEVARMAESVGVDALTVHPRTRSQRYTGRAPWQVIADVVRAVRIPVTGNGDVTSIDEARRMMGETGCTSVMVGRAALGRPWLFDPEHDALASSERAGREAATVAEHLDLIEELFPPGEAAMQMKKQLACYIAGQPTIRVLRGELFRTRTIAEVRMLHRRHLEAGGGFSRPATLLPVGAE